MIVRILPILCIGLLFPVLALAQDHVAMVKQPRGDVVVVRDGATIALSGGDRLFKGDVVRTGADSAVGVMFVDGTRLGVGANSECQIDEYLFDPLEDKYAFDIFMKKGSAVYSSGKMGTLKPQSIKIRTPRATVGVRGTRFLIKVK